MIILLLFKVLEYKTNHDEIGGHSDGQYCQWGYSTTETQPQEEIEQHDVQHVVDCMGAAKTYAVAG